MKKDPTVSIKQLICLIDSGESNVELIEILKGKGPHVLNAFLDLSKDAKIANKSSINPSYNKRQRTNKKSTNYILIKNELIRMLAKIEDEATDNTIDYRSKNIFILKRKMIDLEILTYKGIRDFSMNEMNEIADQFIRLEAYEDAMASLEKKRIYYSIYKNQSDIARLDEKILQVAAKKKALERATAIYLNSGRQMRHIKDNTSLTNYFRKVIAELEVHYQKTKSKLILYYLYFTQFAFSDFQNNFNNTEKYLGKIEQLLLHSKVVFTNNRYHQLLLNKSYLHIKTGDLKLASKLIYKSFRHTKSIYNNIIGRYLLSNIWLSQGKTKELFDEIKYIDSVIAENSVPTEFIQKHLLLKATYYFTERDYKNCLSQLVSVETEYKLNEELKINVRLLKIMTLIELERTDEAVYAIDNFRKHIERERNSRLITPRIILIKKILIAYLNTNFTGLKNKKICNNVISRLEECNSYKWQILSSEPIPINVWLMSKLCKV